MCEPVSISLAIASSIALTIASTTANAIMQQQQASAQKKLAKAAANLKRTQVSAKQALGAESAGQRMFELAKAAQLAKGTVASANLADRSVAAIGRSIGFELGQDKATIQKNQETAALETGARLRGIDLDLDSQLLQIGDTSGLRLGLQIGGAVVAGIGSAATAGLAGGFDGFKSTSATALTAAKAAIPTPQISAGGTSAQLSGRI